jgi:hypothetical protein
MSSTPVTDPEWDDFDRALLASARLDQPQKGALTRAARVLSAATLGSAVLVSASTSLGASGGLTGATAAVGVSLAALGKALLVGALVGVGFVSVVNGGFSSAPEQAPRVAGRADTPGARGATLQRVAAPGSHARSALPASKPAATLLDEAPPATRPITSKAAPPRERDVPRAMAASAPVATSLSVEVALLDQARAALVRKDPAAALSALDRYAALAIGRSLEREASLLRIEALRDLGQAASAAELVKRLVDQDPHGLTGQRARELMR